MRTYTDTVPGENAAEDIVQKVQKIDIKVGSVLQTKQNVAAGLL